MRLLFFQDASTPCRYRDNLITVYNPHSGKAKKNKKRNKFIYSCNVVRRIAEIPSLKSPAHIVKCSSLIIDCIN